MSKNNKSRFDNKYGNLELLEIIESQIININGSVFAIIQKDSKNTSWGVILPLLINVCESCSSIEILIKSGIKETGRPNPKAREVFIITRSILETILNIVFILAKGNETAEKARSHYIQKAYKDLNTEFDILGQVIKQEFSGKVDLEANVDLKNAIEEFTTSKGKSINNWTPENPSEKLEAIHKKYGKDISLSLQFGLFSIYGNASEIIHGTFYGSMFLLGLTEPNKSSPSAENVEKHQRGWISLILFKIANSINSLLTVISIELPNPKIEEIVSLMKKEIKSQEWVKHLDTN